MDVLYCWMYLKCARLAQVKFCSPGQPDPTQPRLGEFWANSTPTYFTTSVKNVISHTLDVILKIPTIKS